MNRNAMTEHHNRVAFSYKERLLHFYWRKKAFNWRYHGDNFAARWLELSLYIFLSFSKVSELRFFLFSNGILLRYSIFFVKRCLSNCCNFYKCFTVRSFVPRDTYQTCMRHNQWFSIYIYSAFRERLILNMSRGKDCEREADRFTIASRFDVPDQRDTHLRQIIKYWEIRCEKSLRGILLLT